MLKRPLFLSLIIFFLYCISYFIDGEFINIIIFFCIGALYGFLHKEVMSKTTRIKVILLLLLFQALLTAYLYFTVGINSKIFTDVLSLLMANIIMSFLIYIILGYTSSWFVPRDNLVEVKGQESVGEYRARLFKYLIGLLIIGLIPVFLIIIASFIIKAT